MKIPQFYNPNNVTDWNYTPDTELLIKEANNFRYNGVKTVEYDTKIITLLVIDQQNDFCLPDGALYAAGKDGNGAVGDTTRIAEFIYRNIDVITNIQTTLDTHFTYQIFFPSFWVGKDGNHPEPHSIIGYEDVVNEKWSPNPLVANFLCSDYDWLKSQCEHYTSELEKDNKYKLRIWPYHAMVGTPGHNLNGLIHEATMFHSLTRGIQIGRTMKGGNPFTEHYSVFLPEVTRFFDGKVIANANQNFVDQIFGSDYIIICGEAASHCVKNTVEDMWRVLRTYNPILLNKIYLMKDCMSPIVNELEDFTPDFLSLLSKCKEWGINVVESTTDIREWKGIEL